MKYANVLNVDRNTFVLVHLKIVLALSVVEILHFWVVSMATLIEASNNN